MTSWIEATGMSGDRPIIRGARTLRTSTRVSGYAHDGEFLHSQGYLDVPFKGFMSVRPVAAHPDGSIVFRDEISGGIGEYKGRLRHPAQFVAVRRDGSFQVVAEAQGDEDTLLDVRGDLVLLRRLDEFDVPRAVVSRLRAPPD